MKKFWFTLFTIIFVLVVDLATKHFLFKVEYFNVIPNVVSIASNGGNTGAAWGMFSGKTLWLILVSLIMITALLIYNHFVKNKNGLYCLSFGFIMGGALGNLFDRVVLNYVRDFIYLNFFPSFPTFNFADTFLTIGAILLAIFILFVPTGEKKNGK